MTLFRKRPGLAIAEPAPDPDPDPEAIADPDPEPPKRGPDGFMSREWERWSWRDAERRLEANKARARIGYTPAQMATVVEAERARAEAAGVVERLLDQRAEAWTRKRHELEELDQLRERRAVTFPADERDVVAILEEAVADIDAKLERARTALRERDVAYRRTVDAADEHLARRRSAVPA